MAAEADRERGQDRCPSLNRHGIQCRGKRSHGALHSAEIEGVLYVWSDSTSPALAIDLLRSND
jgi:hypothetical protein